MKSYPYPQPLRTTVAMHNITDASHMSPYTTVISNSVSQSLGKCQFTAFVLKQGLVLDKKKDKMKSNINTGK